MKIPPFISKLKSFVKNNTKKVYNLYKNSLHFLALHKLPAFVLSHGGLHIIVLLFCIICAFFMYGEVQKYNKRTFRQFSFRIEGDTLKNYEINHIEMKIFRTKTDSVSNDVFSYRFQYREKIDSSRLLNTLLFNAGTYKGKIIDLVQKITVTVDDSTLLEKSKKNNSNNKGKLREPNQLTANNTAKYKANYIVNNVTSFNFMAFTADDHVKKDLYTFTAPNIAKDWDSDNPYLCCFYGVHAIAGTYDLDENSVLEIQYNDYPYKVGQKFIGKENDMFNEDPMTIETVLPKPTEMTLEKISYKGKDIEKVFEQGGIYVTAVDHVKEAKAIRMEFLWTVLIGTIIAFALDIAVHLIIKWRKL